jgi:hypothetical protein
MWVAFKLAFMLAALAMVARTSLYLTPLSLPRPWSGTPRYSSKDRVREKI